MIKSATILFFFSLLLSLAGFSQTYEVIKVEIKCEAKPLTNSINSEGNDFSPYVYDNTLYFSSDRDPDIMLTGQNNWSRTKYINLYQATLKGDITPDTKMRAMHLVSERFYTGSHVGPASFSATGDTVFLSQVRVSKKEGTFHPQLYLAVKVGKRFSKLKPLPFNNKAYALGHPFYDSKNQRLYFSSTMPGGKGGSDIYYSDLTDKGWTEPRSFEEVNTEEDELFPFLVNNIFFFASNPNGKNGGLDLFWKLIDGTPKKQLVEGLNSDKDDFGIYIFPGMTKGYYSSNRTGNDDLYYFDMDCEYTIRNEMAGEFKFKRLKGLPADITIQIVDDNDYVLYETKTDKDGKFIFKEIDYDKSYSIRAMTEDDLELTLYNQNGEGTADLLGDEDNVFLYRNISTDNTGTLSLIPDDMVDFGLNEGHLSGQLIYEDKPNEFPANMEVVLIDENGTETLSRITDAQGNFDFEKLSMSKNYILKIPAGGEDILLLIYDLKGNVVAQLKTNEEGEFTYRKINPDYNNRLELMEEGEEDPFSLNNQTIWGYFEYENDKKLSRKDLIVRAYDENGNLVDEELTDGEGVFRFKNLPPESSLLFKLEENGDNFILDDFTLYIFDRNGQKIAGLKRGQDGFFTYRPLGYNLDNELSQLEEDNLDFILGGQSKLDRILVYFDSNQSQVKSSDLKILSNLAKVLKENPKARVEINAYADSKSSDEYNLILSKKRGEWIVDYLTKKGISKSRLIVNAYGESRLVDKDNDALNRRAEIHIY